MTFAMRIAVTTSRDRCAGVVEKLAAAGISGVPLPCISIEARPRSQIAEIRRAVADADLVLVTSRRAIESVWPSGGMSPVPVAAVGESTANAVRRAGGRVETVGTRGARSLIEELAECSAGATIVFPRSGLANTGPLDVLRSAGATVLDLVAYDTVAVAPHPAPVDGAIFSSPSAIEGWMLSRTFQGLDPIVAIGDTTAHHLRRHGAKPDLIPPAPNLGALVASLFERTSP